MGILFYSPNYVRSHFSHVDAPRDFHSTLRPIFNSPDDGGVRRPLRGQDPLGQSLGALSREGVAEGGGGAAVAALPGIAEERLQRRHRIRNVGAVRDDDVAQVHALPEKCAHGEQNKTH